MAYRRTQGFGKLIERLNRIPKKVKAETEKALVKSGEETASAMKLLAPESPKGSHGNPPGMLKASIVVTPPGGSTPAYVSGGRLLVPEGSVAVTAGNTDVRYAHLVEHGTRRAAAQPFFFPGYRLTRTRNQRRVRRALNKAIKESKNG